MKKIFLIFAITLITALSLFSGCSTPSEGDKDLSDDIIIADFEKWAPDFQLIRIMNDFGAVNVNGDLTYVKNGKYSAKLQPLGSYSMGQIPYLYFPLQSSLFGFDYCDFSKAEKITASIYNAEEYDVNMLMGLITKIVNVDSVIREQGKYFVLEPGWNDIEYLIDLNILSMAYDIKDFQGIYFLFENAGSRDIEDAPVLYVDDIIIRQAKEPKAIENLIILDTNEIANFEKLYQAYIFSVDSPKFKCIPELELVSASDYGIAATSGTRVLRMVTKAGDAAEETWPRITLAEKIMQASNLKNIDPDDYENTYFCFDVYNNTDKNMIFYPQFYSSGERNWQPFALTTIRGDWTTFRIKLSEINAASVTDPGILGLAWAEYPSSFAGDLEFFFDSFRLETVN